MSAFEGQAPDSDEPAPTASLTVLLDEHRFRPDDTLVASDLGSLTLADLRREVARLAAVLAQAGVKAGRPVGALVGPGPSSIVIMFAVWTVGAVYVPINRRLTPAEVGEFLAETPVSVLLGTDEDLDRVSTGIATVAFALGIDTDADGATTAAIRRRLSPGAASGAYPADVALVLRTSGTTGRPKAVLLRHSGTLAALDASLQKLRGAGGRVRAGDPGRGNGGQPARRSLRMNLIPVSMALWAGIFNTLFSLRAGFGVALLTTFTPGNFVEAVRRYGITSTVLAPPMITMLTESPDVDDLAPLGLVRSITAPLSPEVAKQFHDRFGVIVLNSYGQTELGGEVVGWTMQDLREFGEHKLGAAGRPYDDVEVRIRTEDGTDAAIGELGEILVRSPFRMRGYAGGRTESGGGDTEAAERFVDGYLRTGDIGCLDADNFLWVQGRVSDMINRGGLKVFPDEVENVLRRHPSVRDAAVAGIPDHRLGEVPHAWVISRSEASAEQLDMWCREYIAPYKVPAGFTFVTSLPRNAIGKLVRRALVSGHAQAATAEPGTGTATSGDPGERRP